jgi:hypothetical protein
MMKIVAMQAASSAAKPIQPPVPGKLKRITFKIDMNLVAIVKLSK